MYYENEMTEHNKIDETILKSIIKNKIKRVNSNGKLKLNIYYKNLKTKNLVIMNNISELKINFKNSHVVYVKSALPNSEYSKFKITRTSSS